MQDPTGKPQGQSGRGRNEGKSWAKAFMVALWVRQGKQFRIA